jgi:hypothetical protein
MECLRTRGVGGRAALQTPIITLRNERTGQTGTLVLTAHLGEPKYFAAISDAIRSTSATVFFESIRSRDDRPEHWREKYHRLLWRIRQDLYVTLSDLEGLAFQGNALPPGPDWVNADVDCCEFAGELQRRNVSTRRYEMALDLLDGLLSRARSCSQRAAKTLATMLKFGLIFVSVGYVFEFIKWLPSSRGFQSVAAEWRNEVAARIVTSQARGDWVLVYGAAHGPGLLELFGKAGYRETEREWQTVFFV